MTNPILTDSDVPAPELLVRFEQELLDAPDRWGVYERYRALRPDLEGQLRELVEAIELLDGAPDATATWGARSRGFGPDGGPVRFGPYRVHRLIGRGGMGEVYEAVEEPLGRSVAVKTIRGNKATDSDRLRRFERERRVLARLHHTNIVPIFSTGCEGEVLYFAMPCINGASLGQVVKTARSREQSGTPLSGTTFEDLLEAARANPEPKGETASAGDTDHRRLSGPYVRTSVGIMATVALALHHVHEAGVIHRDLKPANIMIEPGGHPWVLDFGLAALLSAAPDVGPTTADTPVGAGGPDQGMTAGPLGTPAYMAPEQHGGATQADVRLDVWGLGVTLYELVTLCRAFPSAEAALTSEPVPPRQVNPRVGRDLEAVILQALHKDPARRYPTARALADDLNRWLRLEPVAARPARSVRSLWLWSRRRPGAASAVLVAALALLATTMAAQAEARADRAKLAAKQRESELQALERLRLGTHANGWSNEVRKLVGALAGAEFDSNIQAQAAASLVGLDARRIKAFEFDTDAATYDARRKRWLFHATDGRLFTWDPATDATHEFGSAGPGGFAVRADGTALHAGVATDPRTLELRDVAASHVLRTFAAPIEGPAEIVALAVTPGGTRVGATARRLDASGKPQGDAGVLAVWDADSGRLLMTIARMRATAMAMSADGTLLAAGDEAGHVSVWPVGEGEPIASFDTRNRVDSLQFGRDPTRRTGPGRAGSGWLLAAGDAGGTVTIWDLHARVPRCVCRGGNYDVLALAFRPDAMTLASAGRGLVKLWDVATGRLLLDLSGGSYVHAVAFSDDGKTLAVGCRKAFGPGGGLALWSLEDHRGIQELRGLLGRIEKVIVSADAKLVAALSQDWQIGVWDRAAGCLLHLFDAPRGIFTDNAALAFSPDGRRLAGAAGEEVLLWDLSAGAVVQTWKLPKGFQDNLAFHGDQLLSIRIETTDGRVPPYGSGPKQYPRRCRIRDLFGRTPLTPIHELSDFNRHVFQSAVSKDGRYLAIEGLGGTPGGQVQRIARLYDAPTGELIRAIPTLLPVDYDNAHLRFDPAGSILVHKRADTPEGTLMSILTVPALRSLGAAERHSQSENIPFSCWHDQVTRWHTTDAGDSASTRSMNLVKSSNGDHPLVAIAADEMPSSNLSEFSRDGRFLIWGNRNATVTVCDLPEIQRRLAELHLGW